MTTADQSPTSDVDTDLWLTPSQLSSWLSVVRLFTRLPWAIDTQLQRDADLSMGEYMVMAMLRDVPTWTRGRSDLPDPVSTSPSGLSHVVKGLEAGGYARREPDPTDGRFTN